MNRIFESNQPVIEEQICSYLDNDRNGRDLKSLQLVSQKAHSMVQSYFKSNIVKRIFTRQELGPDICANVLSFLDRETRQDDDAYYEGIIVNNFYDPEIASVLGVSNEITRKAILLSRHISRNDVTKVPELCSSDSELVLDFDYSELNGPSKVEDLTKAIRRYFYIEDPNTKEFKPRFPNAKELILRLSSTPYTNLFIPQEQENAILTHIFDAVPNLRNLVIKEPLNHISNYPTLSKLSSLKELHLERDTPLGAAPPQLDALLQYLPQVETMSMTSSSLGENHNVEPNQSLKNLSVSFLGALPSSCEEIVKQAQALKNLTLSRDIFRPPVPNWTVGWLYELSSLTLQNLEARTIEFDREATKLEELTIIVNRETKKIKFNSPGLTHLTIRLLDLSPSIEGLHHSTKLKSLEIYGGSTFWLNLWEVVDQIPSLEQLSINSDVDPPREILQNSQIRELAIHAYGLSSHLKRIYFRNLPRLNALHTISSENFEILEITTRKDL